MTISLFNILSIWNLDILARYFLAYILQLKLVFFSLPNPKKKNKIMFQLEIFRQVGQICRVHRSLWEIKIGLIRNTDIQIIKRKNEIGKKKNCLNILFLFFVWLTEHIIQKTNKKCINVNVKQRANGWKY